MTIGRLIPRQRAWRIVEWLQRASLRAAIRRQHLGDLVAKLSSIVPDVGAQYTTFAIASDTARLKIRAQHASQVQLALDALGLVAAERKPSASPMTVVDIGDSAGTHVLYLKALVEQDSQLAGAVTRWISVNLDPIAVEKIRARGLEAILARAEDLQYALGIDVSLFMSFEMLEHLTDPIAFLDSLSRRASADWLVVTVPYIRTSRVGLHHMRHGHKRPMTPENTHIFELSPPDWRLLFQQAGWRVERERIYRQYPRWGIWRITQPVWRRVDFEGFYGVILRRDRSWASCYQSAVRDPLPKS